MKVICVEDYSSFVSGEEYDLIERSFNSLGDPLLTLKDPIRQRNALVCESYKGRKMFKTREEIREEKLNLII